MTHLQTHHVVAKWELGSERRESDGDDGGDTPRTYRMAFPERAEPKPCPVKGCSFRALTRTATKVHFWHQHVRDTVVILEEGNLPNQWCPLCDMMVPWKALNGTHRRTAQCKRGAERKICRLAADEEREVTARDFSAYGFSLYMVTSFGYLGQVIFVAYDNWTAVVRNLS